MQHALPTTKMREKSARNRYRQVSCRQAVVAKKQLNEIGSASVVPPHASFELQKPRWMSSTRKRKQFGSLRIVSVVAPRNSEARKLAMAYSGVRCVKSLAKIFTCHESTAD